MRPLLFLTPVLLASCGNLVSQREILRRSQAEVASRESWSDTAFILIDEKPDDLLQFHWVVKAGSLDNSDYPRYTGLNFVPGTERKLRFTREGCLIGYGYNGSRCHYPAGSPAAAGPSVK